MLIHEKLAQIIESNYPSLNNIEKSNLFNVAFYCIAKQAPYFKNSNHLLRLFHFDGKIRVGINEIDYVKGYRNNFVPTKPLFLENETFPQYAQSAPTEQDVEDLKVFVNMLENSDDIQTLIFLINEHSENSARFLFNLSYSYNQRDWMVGINMIKYLHSFININDYSDGYYQNKNFLKLNYHEEDYQTIFQDIPSELKFFVPKKESELLDLGLKGHPFLKKHCLISNHFFCNDREVAIDMFNKNLFFEAKTLTIDNLNYKLNLINEEALIKSYNEKIKEISSVIFKEFEALNSSKKKTSVLLLENLQSLKDRKEAIPKNLFSLGDEKLNNAFLNMLNIYDDELSLQNNESEHLFIAYDGVTINGYSKLKVSGSSCNLELFEISNITDITSIKKLFNATMDYIENNFSIFLSNFNHDIRLPDISNILKYKKNVVIFNELMEKYKAKNLLIFHHNLCSARYNEVFNVIKSLIFSSNINISSQEKLNNIIDYIKDHPLLCDNYLFTPQKDTAVKERIKEELQINFPNLFKEGEL